MLDKNLTIDVGQREVESGYRRSLSYVDASTMMVASLLINLLSIAAPLTALLVYDKVLTNQSHATLTVLAVGAVLLLFVESALRICRSMIMTRASAHADFVGRNWVLSAFIRKQGSIPEDRALADLNAKLVAVSTLRELRFAWVTMIVDLPFGLLFLLLVAAIGGWTVALPASVCALALIAMHVIAAKSAKALEYAQTADRNRSRFVEHTARSLHGIAALATQVPVADRFVLRQIDRANAMAEHGYLDLLRRDVLAVFSQILIGSVVVAGAISVLNDNLSLGGLAACTLLAGRALEPLQNCFHLATLSRQAKIARQDLSDLHTPTESAQSESWDRPPSIQAENCMILGRDGVSPLITIPKLDVASGEIICISGPRGAGKSTFSRALLGLSPVDGTLNIAGLNPDGPESDLVRQQCGLLNRDLRLPSGRILDVLTDGSERLYADVRYLAHLIGLDASVRRLTLGYDTILGGDGLHQVPDGVRQQIAICRILAKKKKLLIIDDLPAAVDATTLIKLADVLKALTGEATVVIFSDHPALKALANRHFEIRGGRLIELLDVEAAS